MTQGNINLISKVTKEEQLQIWLNKTVEKSYYLWIYFPLFLVTSISLLSIEDVKFLIFSGVMASPAVDINCIPKYILV